MTGMTTAVVEEINPETPDTAEFLETQVEGQQVIRSKQWAPHPWVEELNTLLAVVEDQEETLVEIHQGHQVGTQAALSSIKVLAVVTLDHHPHSLKAILCQTLEAVVVVPA